MTPHLIVQWGIALIVASLAATAIACALAAWDDRQRIRHGRIPLQPLEPIDLGQEPPEPGSEREANLLLARWVEEGKRDA